MQFRLAHEYTSKRRVTAHEVYACPFFNGHSAFEPAVTVAAQATVDNINVTAVPEPASWALMLLGSWAMQLRGARPRC
jgi:hypothetical protein